MKKYYLLLMLLFLTIGYSQDNGLITFKVYNSNNDYLGFDNLKLYKTAIYKEGNQTYPIEYYAFYSERIARYYLYLPEESDIDVNYDTDYTIKGMIVVDNKGNVIFFKSEEGLKTKKEQKRTIVMQWNSQKKGYDIQIVDPNRLKSEQKQTYFLKSNEKLPIITRLKNLDYIFISKNPFKGTKKIKGINIFNYKRRERQSLAFSFKLPGESDFNPPKGKTKFFPLDPIIFDFTIKSDKNDYFFADFNFNLKLNSK